MQSNSVANYTPAETLKLFFAIFVCNKLPIREAYDTIKLTK